MFDLLPSKRKGELQNPFSEMEEMARKMWFDFPFHSLEKDAGLNWSPRLDVSENDKAIEVVADLPGMDKEDINVSLEGDLLIIKGEKKEEKEKKTSITIQLSVTAVPFIAQSVCLWRSKVTKSRLLLKKGVLSLKLPKSEKSKKPAQITIK